MIIDIFENREKTVWSLFKLAECLGRSLRENVALFYIDSDKKKVSFITESDSVITGTFNTDDQATICDIDVVDSDSFKEGAGFDALVSDQVHEFVGNLASNNLHEATTGFDDILKLWEYRLKFENVKNKLDEKAQSFDETHSILRTPEVSKLTEITPGLISYLIENKDSFEGISEITNAVKLSKAVAGAFDFNAMTKEDLKEQGTYSLKPEVTDDVFDMICKQELVKKELLESKKSFDVVWATNEKIKSLAGMLFESDDKIAEALADCLEEMPYMALVSKATLAKTTTNALSFNDGVGISEKDIKVFASKLFEMKKPVKEELIRMLNEDYGINLQNLKETPSFRSLLNTQVVIFEALSRLSPKNSLQKQILSEVSDMLKYKNGVESIDINEYLSKVFTSAGYLEEETKEKKKASGAKAYMKPESLDMDKVSRDLKNIGGVFDMIKKNMQYSSEEGLEAEPAPAPEQAPAPAPMAPEQAAAPPMAPEQAMAPPMAPEQGMEPPMGAPVAPEVAGAEDDAEMLANLSDLEALVNDLADELGMTPEGTPLKNDKENNDKKNKEDK